MSGAPVIYVLIDSDGPQRALKSLQKAMESGQIVRRAGETLARAARDMVADLTPRQRNVRERRGSTRRYGVPLWRQWYIAADEAVQAAVYSATIKSKAVETAQGTLVLASVEHGAGRHDMIGVFGWFEGSNAVRARSAFLNGRQTELHGGRASNLQSGDTIDVRFLVAREAGWINVGSHGASGFEAPGVIHHPGSPAHHMVQHTKSQLSEIAAAMEAQIAAEYQDAFALKVT